MDKITQTSSGERLLHSAIFASVSATGVWVLQSLVWTNVDQILVSFWADFWQTIVTSFLNWTFYNLIKKFLSLKTRFSEKDIIKYSIVIVSTLWVWCPKYLIHTLAKTYDPEMIALVYTATNIVVMWLYEKHILQKKNGKMVAKLDYS